MAVGDSNLTGIVANTLTLSGAIFSGNLAVYGTTGSVFFVSSVSGSSGNDGLSASTPKATIAQAIALCTAAKGDVVIVMPGHAESLSGASALALNKSGVTIIGLGNGANRPALTLHTTDALITISAANVTLRNFQILTDVDAVVTCFSITAAGVTLDRVDFVETAACACLQFVLTTAAADDLTISNSKWVQTATAATALQQWIVLVGADRARITDNFANLKGYATSNPANGVVVGATTASSDILIARNVFITTNSTGAIAISLLANSTGFVINNSVASAKTAIAGQVACANAYATNNYANNTVNTSGLLDPVVDS